MRRTGNTLADNRDARRLLEADELVLVPLPSSRIIEFHRPLELSEDERIAADDPGRMLAIADRVRDVIQAGVYRDLLRRQSVFAIS